MGSHVVDFIDLTGDMEIEDDLVSGNIFLCYFSFMLLDISLCKLRRFSLYLSRAKNSPVGGRSRRFPSRILPILLPLLLSSLTFLTSFPISLCHSPFFFLLSH